MPAARERPNLAEPDEGIHGEDAIRARGDDQSADVAALATRGFIGRPLPTILLATLSGMLAMSAAIATGLPIIVSMVALFAGILLVFGFRTGDMGYRLTTEGLARSFRPLAARIFNLAGREQSFRFDSMRFYQRYRDWSRYRAEEVETLVISVRKPPYRIVIHDMIDKAAFGDFADRFEQFAKRATPQVERQPGFYQTVWAKLLTVVFAVMAIGLTAAFFAGMLSPTGVFRLMIIIVPGVIYMAWRVIRWRREVPLDTDRRAEHVAVRVAPRRFDDDPLDLHDRTDVSKWK